MKIPDTITAKVREFDIRESLPFTLSFAKRNPDEIETIVADKINARVNEAIHEAVLDVRRETIAEERARVRGIIDWELTPHGYESDDKYMEHFACELKEKYKNKILSSLDTLTDKE